MTDPYLTRLAAARVALERQAARIEALARRVGLTFPESEGT